MIGLLGEPQSPKMLVKPERLAYADFYTLQSLIENQDGQYVAALNAIKKVVDYLDGLDTDDAGTMGTLHLWHARYQNDRDERYRALEKAYSYFGSKQNDDFESCLYGRACVLSALAALDVDDIQRAKHLSEGETAFTKALTRLEPFFWELDTSRLRSDPFLKLLLERPAVEAALDEFKWQPSELRGPPPPATFMWRFNPPLRSLPFEYKTYVMP
jgi:hypothetical protein